MKALLNLFLLAGSPQPVDNGPHPCLLDVNHLNVESRLKMAIGCSTVNKRTVLRRDALEKIYIEGSRAK